LLPDRQTTPRRRATCALYCLRQFTDTPPLICRHARCHFSTTPPLLIITPPLPTCCFERRHGRGKRRAAAAARFYADIPLMNHCRPCQRRHSLKTI